MHFLFRHHPIFALANSLASTPQRLPLPRSIAGALAAVLLFTLMFLSVAYSLLALNCDSRAHAQHAFKCREQQDSLLSPLFWAGLPLVALLSMPLSLLLSEQTQRAFVRFIRQYALNDEDHGSPIAPQKNQSPAHLSTESVSFLGPPPPKLSLPFKHGPPGQPSALNTSSSRIEDLDDGPRAKENFIQPPGARGHVECSFGAAVEPTLTHRRDDHSEEQLIPAADQSRDHHEAGYVSEEPSIVASQVPVLPPIGNRRVLGEKSLNVIAEEKPEQEQTQRELQVELRKARLDVPDLEEEPSSEKERSLDERPKTSESNAFVENEPRQETSANRKSELAVHTARFLLKGREAEREDKVAAKRAFRTTATAASLFAGGVGLAFVGAYLWVQCFYLSQRHAERALLLFFLSLMVDLAFTRPLALAIWALAVKVRARKNTEELHDLIGREEARLRASLYASYRL